MNNKGKYKSFIISDKINIFAQVDVHTGIHIELVSWLGLSVSIVNTA
jgi:hypothetical protein